MMRVVALAGVRLCRSPGCDGEATGPSGIDAYCPSCRRTMRCVAETTIELRRLRPARAHVDRTVRSHVIRAAVAADKALHDALEAEAKARWARQDADQAVALWKRQLGELRDG